MKKSAFALLLLLSAPVRARQPAAITLIPKGGVELRAGPRESWTAVLKSVQIGPGQEVRTKSEGLATILFPDGSRVEMAPKTAFLVESADAKEANFVLGAGKIRAAIAGLFSSRYNIRTNTAVCSVRGTVFEVEAGNSTQINVGEGLVEVKDSKGKEAVVSSEETIRIGEGGMDKPQLVGLADRLAQDAARPQVVRQEMVRDQTRAMLEDLRNLELKANEKQLGKDVIDAFGNRVRLEEYLLRPAANQFKVLFLSERESRFDWGHVLETFHSAIPDDISLVKDIVRDTFFSPTLPKNWLTNFEFYATNTIDGIKESVVLGDPAQINFAGYFNGVQTNLYYPSTIEYQQILSGPGVPGGQRTQFQLSQDWSIITPGQFTWRQFVVNNAGVLTLLTANTLDPTSVVNVAAGGTALVDKTCQTGTCDVTVDPITTISYPRGASQADYLVNTQYRDGSTVSSEKILVSDKGEVLNLLNSNAATFNQEGNYNLEIVVGSSLFQGPSKNIDVLIAPEILSEKKTDTNTPNSINP